MPQFRLPYERKKGNWKPTRDTLGTWSFQLRRPGVWKSPARNVRPLAQPWDPSTCQNPWFLEKQSTKYRNRNLSWDSSSHGSHGTVRWRPKPKNHEQDVGHRMSASRIQDIAWPSWKWSLTWGYRDEDYWGLLIMINQWIINGFWGSFSEKNWWHFVFVGPSGASDLARTCGETSLQERDPSHGNDFYELSVCNLHWISGQSAQNCNWESIMQAVPKESRPCFHIERLKIDHEDPVRPF